MTHRFLGPADRDSYATGAIELCVSVARRALEEDRRGEEVGAESNSGWSGYAIDTPGGSPGLVVVQGVWNAPIVDSDFITGQPTVSSMWVGLDGDTHGNWQTPGGELVQAGAEHDAQDPSNPNQVDFSWHNYQ